MDNKLRLVVGMLGAFAITSIAASWPAEARAIKAKAKPKPYAAGQATTRVAKVSDGWVAFPGYPGHRDRTTFYHPNGRLNGQELFDSISDRAGNAGE